MMGSGEWGLWELGADAAGSGIFPKKECLEEVIGQEVEPRRPPGPRPACLVLSVGLRCLLSPGVPRTADA